MLPTWSAATFWWNFRRSLRGVLYMNVLRRAVGLTSVCVRETRGMTVFVITPIYTIPLFIWNKRQYSYCWFCLFISSILTTPLLFVSSFRAHCCFQNGYFNGLGMTQGVKNRHHLLTLPSLLHRIYTSYISLMLVLRNTYGRTAKPITEISFSEFVLGGVTEGLKQFF